MIEVRGNLWDYEADAVVITTNGAVTNDLRAVMGRGCAGEAKEKFPGVDRWLAVLIKDHGNHVHELMRDLDGNGNEWNLVSFPVKHHWKEAADLKLIERSAQELVELAKGRDWKTIIMPRPGCGNGRRDWNLQVKPILERYLDDRFYVITF